MASARTYREICRRNAGTFVVQSARTITYRPRKPRAAAFGWEGSRVKRRVTLATLVLLALSVLVADVMSQTAAATPAPARKKRVAAFDFDYATVQTYSSAAFGSTVDWG